MRTPTRQQLRLSGWSAIALAITYPWTVAIAFSSGYLENRELNFINALLGIITAGFYAYVFLSLRDYFNHKLNHALLNHYIHIFVFGTLFLAVFNVLSYIIPTLEEISQYLTFFLILFFGIVSILFGRGLLHMKNDLFGLRTALGYTHIFSGVFLASIILFPLAMAGEFVVYVLLGIFLLRASDETDSRS